MVVYMDPFRDMQQRGTTLRKDSELGLFSVLRFWDHLAFLGFVECTFTNVGGELGRKVYGALRARV